MTNSKTAHRSFTWVRDDDGSTYLCSDSAVSADGRIIDKGECLDESENPQNN